MVNSRIVSLPLALVCTAVLAGCGGADESKLIPTLKADQINSTRSEIKAALKRLDCATAKAKLQQAVTQVEGLPSSVDRGLVTNLQEWLGHTKTQIASECEAAANVAPPEIEPSETLAKPQPADTSSSNPTQSTTSKQQTNPAQQTQQNGQKPNQQNGAQPNQTQTTATPKAAPPTKPNTAAPQKVSDNGVGSGGASPDISQP